MPDLIYNVKFKIASKIDDLGGAGAAKSLTQLNEAVDKTNRSTGKLGKEVRDLVAAEAEFVAANNKSKASIDNKRKASQNDLRTIAKTNLEARARIKQIREERIDLDRFIQTNKLNTAERTKLLGISTRLENQEKALILELQRGRAALQGQENETEQLTTATERLAAAKRKLGKGVGSNNKAFSTANQTLFSFSDAVQDSAQFIQGGQVNFAQGMRAVGNNIGFTAELMGNLTTKTGGLKNAFKALGRSMAGPGGLLIGINLLVTAATVLPQILGKNKQSAEDLEKSLEGLNDDIRKTVQLISEVGAFELGIEGLENEKQVLLDMLETQKEINDSNLQAFETEKERAENEVARLDLIASNIHLLEREGITLEEITNAKEDLVRAEAEIARIKAENKKTDEEIRDLTREIADETEARRLAGQKLQDEGFVDALRATLNVEAKVGFDFSLDGTEELDALFQSFIDEELARESIKIKEPVPLEFEDGFEIIPPKFQEVPNMFDTIDGMVSNFTEQFRAVGNPFAGIDEIIADSADLMFTEEDLGPAIGTIAFAQEQIKELTLEFNNTLESEEAASLANRINILKDFIAERQELLDGSPKEDEGIFSGDNLKMASQFTKGIVSLRKTELKSELQVAKARGASAEQLEAIRKKQFLVEKRSAIAETLINTAKAIAENLGRPRKIAFAAALGAIQLAKIRATKFGGGGGGGGGAARSGGGGAGAAGQEAPQFTQSVNFLNNAQDSEVPSRRLPDFVPSSPITNQVAPTVDVNIDRAGLAIAVNRGQQDLLNNSTSI
tara:strand:- start:2248 stop:4617 length:2370 start_codon:yes stop_codon:yes gene_type:complete